MDDLISIIIPVYNSGNYLRECIESVLNQTYKNLEIIFINDASKDNSLEIIKKYATKDLRIKYENFAQNKGAATARNYGLKTAKGNYLCFIDSDDWIDINYIEIMADTIIKNKADIAVNRNIMSCESNQLYNFDFPFGQSKIPNNIFIDIEKDAHNISPAGWCKIDSTNFLKRYSISFPDGYAYEDMLFHFVSFAYAKRIFLFNGAPYYFRKNTNSVTSKMREETDKILNILDLVYEYYKSHNFLENGIKIYCTMPFYIIQNEKIYMEFKKYFNKIGKYILNNPIYNDLDKFFCSNILETNGYEDYIAKFSPNVTMSYIRNKKCAIMT